MRILALSWKHPGDRSAGGAERYLLEVTKRWSEWGHDITIAGPRCTLSSDARTSWTHFRYLSMGNRWSVFRRAVRYLRDHHLEYDCVLETVSTRPFSAHRVAGSKAVALYHQTAEEVWNQEYPWPVGLAGRYCLEPGWVRKLRGARVVANSASTSRALLRFGVSCEAIVPPGCDPPVSLEHRIPPGTAPRLLWMGRMVRTKLPMDAITAFQLIRGSFPDGTLDMVGTGYLEAQLRASAPSGVTFHGHLCEEAKRELLQSADLLLLPGTREGWGIVAMEAAAHGVPAVAYDIPGLRDSVLQDKTGRLTTPSPEALSDQAVDILRHPALWLRMSEAAQLRARAFTWDATADSLWQVMSRRPAGHRGRGQLEAPSSCEDDGRSVSTATSVQG
ncbi:MAG: glycosyltransferase family 4 protein [Candidatus Dormibacteria bacterium]